MYHNNNNYNDIDDEYMNEGVLSLARKAYAHRAKAKYAAKRVLKTAATAATHRAMNRLVDRAVDRVLPPDETSSSRRRREVNELAINPSQAALLAVAARHAAKKMMKAKRERDERQQQAQLAQSTQVQEIAPIAAIAARAVAGGVVGRAVTAATGDAAAGKIASIGYQVKKNQQKKSPPPSSSSTTISDDYDALHDKERRLDLIKRTARERHERANASKVTIAPEKPLLDVPAPTAKQQKSPSERVSTDRAVYSKVVLNSRQ